MFGIDLRSLAAFRMGVAGVLLLDLWYRAHEITAYFTDVGVLPRIARIELFETHFRDTWSLHLMGGTLWSQVLLFMLAAVLATWLLVGYRTRLAAFGSWILLCSLDARNPVILDSGDVLLRSMLFWGLFLPLGARWSFDQPPADGSFLRKPVITSVATFALLIQLCLMYWFSFAFKSLSVGEMPSPWTHGYSAVYYALNCDAFATAGGIWLRQFPTVMSVMTVSVLWMELFGPLLALSPWRTKWCRGAMVAAFTLLHIGFGLTLSIGLFVVICIVCWWLFLPSEFWDGLAAMSRRWWSTDPAIETQSQQSTEVAGLATNRPVLWLRLARLRAGVDWVRKYGFTSPETVRFRRRWYVDGVVAIVLVYVVIWNVREVNFKYFEPRILPVTWNAPARILGLDQNWSMFAPLPRTEDGWLVMRGTLHDETEVNLWEFDQPLPWEKPSLVSATYHTQRWRKYLDNLTTEMFAPHRMYLCDWLARRWNTQRAAGQEARKVHKVELIHRIELTPPPGHPIPEPETRVLWTWYYE